MWLLQSMYIKWNFIPNFTVPLKRRQASMRRNNPEFTALRACVKFLPGAVLAIRLLAARCAKEPLHES